MIRLIFATATILLSIASASYSAPTPAIKYLMNKPASLFDWGVHHINEHLDVMHITFYLDADELKLKTTQLKTEAAYDWDGNLITIDSNPGGASFIMDDRKAAEKLCGEIVKKIRAELRVDPDNPSGAGAFLVDNFFSHSGYKLEDEPEGLARELLDVIEIRTSLNYWGKTYGIKDKAPRLNCRTPIMSRKVLYDE